MFTVHLFGQFLNIAARSGTLALPYNNLGTLKKYRNAACALFFHIVTIVKLCESLVYRHCLNGVNLSLRKDCHEMALPDSPPQVN
jgi:hypothetical protein